MTLRSFLTGVSMATKLALAAVVVLTIALGVQNWRLRRVQREAGALALQADTLRAHADTSRRAALSEKERARILGDSLAAVSRLVVQRRQDPDALDRALEQQRIALARLTAQVAALQATVTARAPTTEDAAGVRAGEFDLRQAPYSIAATVRLPEPPARGDMAVRVTLDPATVDLRLGCAAPNPAGIRSATATATGPTWLQLALGRVEQSPDLCQSPALARGRAALPWWRRLAPHLSAGYGLQADRDGTIRHGPQVGAHIDLWRP